MITKTNFLSNTLCVFLLDQRLSFNSVTLATTTVKQGRISDKCSFSRIAEHVKSNVKEAVNQPPLISLDLLHAAGIQYIYCNGTYIREQEISERKPSADMITISSPHYSAMATVLTPLLDLFLDNLQMLSWHSCFYFKDSSDKVLESTKPEIIIYSCKKIHTRESCSILENQIKYFNGWKLQWRLLNPSTKQLSYTALTMGVLT